jgi:hypothetical protein
MDLICTCPASAAISDINAVDCIERIGQVVKIGFQRTFSGTTENVITIASANPNLLATWTDLKSQVDSTKVQFTPLIHNPEWTPGEAVEYGGGNTTVGGVPKLLGTDFTAFDFEFLEVPQEIIEQIKQYRCEGEGLSMFLINEAGLMWGIGDDYTTPTTFKGISMATFFVGDKKPGGKLEPDKNMGKIGLYPGWSNGLVAITPSDFNPRTQL